jgi:hypothetical protein
MALSDEVCSPRGELKSSLAGNGLLRITYALAAVMAAGGALLASSVSAAGQTQRQIGEIPPADSQGEICDTSTQDGPEKLSLARPSATTVEDHTNVVAEPVVTSTPSEELKERLTLRSLVPLEASAEPQDPQCKPPQKKNDPTSSVASSTSADSGAQGQLPKGPIVSTLNGEITVDPGEASLREVLQAIQFRTGIQVDYPSGGMDERVFGPIGPAPLREVLTALLYGSGLNYIIQTSEKDSNEIHKLFLSSQTGTGSAAPLQAATQTPGARNEVGSLYGASGFSEEADAGGNYAEPVVPTPPSAADIPGVPRGFNLKQAAAASNKTPAQILDEMQKRQLEILDAQAPPQPQ